MNPKQRTPTLTLVSFIIFIMLSPGCSGRVVTLPENSESTAIAVRSEAIAVRAVLLASSVRVAVLENTGEAARAGVITQSQADAIEKSGDELLEKILSAQEILDAWLLTGEDYPATLRAVSVLNAALAVFMELAEESGVNP